MRIFEEHQAAGFKEGLRYRFRVVSVVVGLLLGLVELASGDIQSDWITEPEERPFAATQLLADPVPWHGVRMGGEFWFMQEELDGTSSRSFRLWRTTDVMKLGAKVSDMRFEDPELVALDDRLILFDRSFDANFGMTVGKVFVYFPGGVQPVLLRSGVSWGNPIRLAHQVLFQGRPEVPNDPDFYTGNEPWVTDGTTGGTRLLKAMAVTDYPAVSGNNFTQGFGRPVLADDGRGVFFESGDLDRDGNPYNQGPGFPSQETRYLAFTDGTPGGTRRLALLSNHDAATGPMIVHGDGAFYPNLRHDPHLRCVWARRGGPSWNPAQSGLGTTVRNSTIGGLSLGKAGRRLWFSLYNQNDPDSSRYAYFEENRTTPAIVAGLPGGSWRNGTVVKAAPDGSAVALFYDSITGQYVLERGGASGWSRVAAVQVSSSSSDFFGCLASGAILRRRDGAVVSVHLMSGHEEILAKLEGAFSWTLQKSLGEEGLLLTNFAGETWVTDGTARGTLPWFDGSSAGLGEFGRWDGRQF